VKERIYGWVERSPMLHARSHSAVTSFKGKIYVFGGGGVGFRSLGSTEIYDPRGDVWSRGKDMPTIRSGAVAATLGDRIYVIGGGVKGPDGSFEFFKIVEIYDPERDTWTSGPSMAMPHDYPASVVLNGSIYVLGGHHPEATKGGPMTDPGFSFCEVFDPARGRWREIAPMPTARFAAAAVVFHNRILVLGGAGLRDEGFRNFDIIEAYDPSRDRWSDAGFSLPWPAAGLGAFTYHDRLFVVGGNSGNRIETRFASFDWNRGGWTELDPLRKGRIVMGVAIIDDTLYLIGGRGEDGKTPLSSVESYLFYPEL